MQVGTENPIHDVSTGLSGIRVHGGEWRYDEITPPSTDVLTCMITHHAAPHTPAYNYATTMHNIKITLTLSLTCMVSIMLCWAEYNMQNTLSLPLSLLDTCWARQQLFCWIKMGLSTICSTVLINFVLKNHFRIMNKSQSSTTTTTIQEGTICSPQQLNRVTTGDSFILTG